MELYTVISEVDYHELVNSKPKEDFHATELNKLKKIIPNLTDKRSSLNNRLDSPLSVIRKFRDDWYTVHTYKKKTYRDWNTSGQPIIRESYNLIDIFLCDQFEGLLKVVNGYILDKNLT